MGNQEKTVQCPQCYNPVEEESRFCSTCGFPLKEKQGTVTYTPSLVRSIDDKLYFSPGDSFGTRYRIIEEIGRGGMGRVYKAEDKELGISVALKMIRPEYSSNPLFIQMFKKETLLARSISHENVIRIHDIGEIDEVKFISMDYIKGHSLRELIHTSGILTIETTLALTRQICEALKAAHQRSIVHQDLNPRNIMIDNDGKVYVMDFGVAKSLETDEIAKQRELVGTPPFISPEQAKQEKVDQRSDLYSLGIIIYEMLTGKKPFYAEGVPGYIKKHLYEKPVPPSKINPRIPPFLNNIVLKCMEKSKKDRYQSVEDILRDLDEHREETRVYPFRAKTGISRYLFYLIPLVLLAAVMFYFFVLKPKSEMSTFPAGGKISVAIMHFENNTGNESLDYWGKALSSLIIHDLSQSRYIRVLTGDRLNEILRDLNLQGLKSYSSADLKKVADRGVVNFIIHGNYTKAEDLFRINTNLHNIVTGELIDSMREEGEGDKTFYHCADNLTPWIKSKLNLGREEIAADFDRDVGEIMTPSQEALKYYVLGKQLYSDGKFHESNDAFQLALKSDPDFALAYKRISENYHYLDEIDQAKKYAQKALSLIDRVSVRDHYLIQGWTYTISEDSYDKAIKTYKEMLQYYPDDEDGNGYLGGIYRNMEEWDLALKHYNRILQIDPMIASPNVSMFYRAKGDYQRAVNVLKVNQNNFFNQAVYHWEMSLAYLCQGKYDLALTEVEKALSLDRDNNEYILTRGNTHQLQGDLLEAERIYRQLGEQDDLLSQLSGSFWMAHLYLMQGQYENCKKEIIQGIADSRKNDSKRSEVSFLLLLAYLSYQTKNFDDGIDAVFQAQEIASEVLITSAKKLALTYAGLILLEMNNISEAKSTAEQLRQLIEKTGIQKDVKCYYCLMGMIAQNEGITSQASGHFEEAISLVPHQSEINDENAFFLYPYALLHYQIGDYEKAIEQFEKIINLSTGRLLWGNLYTKSFYWLGKIFQEKGWIGKAIENYEKCLKIWKNADSDLPEVSDARRLLSLLNQK